MLEATKMLGNGKNDTCTTSVPNGHPQAPQQSERGYWGTKAEFILTVMGAIIGPGNVWRFPYLCYRNGGGERLTDYLINLHEVLTFSFWRHRTQDPFLVFAGVFFIPYILFMFTCGVPLFFLETAIGQYTSQGGITCWRKICPLFQGFFKIYIYFNYSTYLIMYFVRNKL